ncbi:ABC transporter permease subunit [Staphylospora marina]|uniref:ABC transporter permease subunit n=1 Tax=Staphylospora marina TaxID=2490858 RepID=UPI0013DE0C11|nr:ABC transporter permease subunit [Staphylospora marina]
MIEKRRSGRLFLWLGGCLLCLLALIALLAPWIAPYSLSYEEPVRIVNGKPIPAPEPPYAEHWLGKDQKGRDLLTLMLHGLKFTLFFVLIVSLFRVGIGGGIGLLMGMWTKKGADMEEAPRNKEKRLFSVSGLLAGIPPIFLLVWILKPQMGWPLLELTILQGIVIALFGVAPIASTVSELTKELKGRLSILAAKTMGASKGWLIRKHLLPMLKERIAILFMQDMIIVLNTLGQLSIFEIYLGGTHIEELFSGVFYDMSKSFEWVGLIGQNKTWVFVYPFLVWIPLLAYFFLLMSFSFLHKGLESRWRELYGKYPHI